MLRRLRKISLFFIATLLVMGFIFLSSFTKLQELRDRAQTLDAMIEKLKQENSYLEQQIQHFKNEPFYKEKLLREKTGLVQKGEVPIRIVPED